MAFRTLIMWTGYHWYSKTASLLLLLLLLYAFNGLFSRTTWL